MADVSFSESLDRLKESFLWAAAQGGNTQDCESLIEIGADVNWRNHDGDTPLLAACRRGHTETIALLLAHGADSNTTGADWLAPLHICTKRGDAASVDALLNASTSTTLRTKEGQTALDIARAKGYESIYARLMGKRSTIGRPSPSLAEGANPPPSLASSLINNIRLELPTATQSRPGSARDRQPLNPLGRVIQNATSTSGAGAVGTAGTTAVSPSARAASSSGSRTARGADGSWANSETEEDGFMEQVQKLSALRMLDTKTETDKERANDSAGSHKTRPLHFGPPGSGGNSSRVGSTSAYAIMGQTQEGGSTAGDETVTIALRKILDTEKANRKALEIKLEVFKKQNTELLQEFAALTAQLTQSQEETQLLELNSNRLLGESGALNSATIQECEGLEKQLKNALQKIDAKKVHTFAAAYRQC
mmetsp:Transcript_7461/g.16600  ORF Transcript_7461/g.16600 Transcript_7461/m.16600 type:complete len:423 (-) Transcript_7461:526-1794(-)